ncbi:MAG: DUF4345 family protein [Erythrobacter sp.]
MIKRFRSGIGSWYPICAGCIFLALGIATLIHPEVLSYYSIGLDEPSARTAMRAMVGGGEVGIAIALLFGGYIRLSLSQRCQIAAVIFICVGLSRLFAVTIEGADALTMQPFREAAIELTLGGLGLWAAQIAKPKLDVSSI